jgi:small subunit ribosomal protein S2
MTTSDVPKFTMRQLLEAGVHFGHQTHRWNPKMDPFIYGSRNQIHIMDLRESAPMLSRALVAIRDVVSNGGRVLFVGTKRQASDPIKEKAGFCGQYYVNHRWLGGMLTNWKTISNSIRRLRTLEEQLAEDTTGLTKKENLNLTRERDKLERALGGIKDMGGLPDILFVVDTVREDIAIKEAKKLGIPVIGICDTNSNPEVVDYPIPGNDDAGRAINLYLDLASRAVISGLRREQAETGVDLGAQEEAMIEEIPAAAEVAVAAEEAAPAEAAPAEAAPAEAAPAEAAPAEAAPEVAAEAAPAEEKSAAE